jgi:hypothetical protein
MFGSGHNPYQAAALAEQEKKLAEAAWGRELKPLPKGVKKEELYVFGEFSETLYNSLMEESGAAERLLDTRRESAKKIASLPQTKAVLRYKTTDAYRREREYESEFLILENLSLEDAEMVVLKKAQHPDKKEFWEELYGTIRELTGIKLSLY